MGCFIDGTPKGLEGEWHHRAPDYRLVYCGPKESSKEEEAKKYRRNRLDEASVPDTIDEPEMDFELNSKRKEQKLYAKS